MCGILGLPSDRGESGFEKALERIAHRGPDQTGIGRWGGYLLGHRRLSIIDIEGGAQPMYDPQERGCILYNGEVYNYRELADAFPSLKTRSDTEIALRLGLERRDYSWLNELDGMFALAIVTPDDLLLARDPLGVKPLYIGECGGKIAFSSEIKGLLEVSDNISEFPPGHVFTPSMGMTKYRELSPPPPSPLAEGLIIQRLRNILRNAVESRLAADVPVGVFLSGGLDSSLIAAFAKRKIPRLHTFAVGMAGASDLIAARQVAQALGTRHHERVFTLKDALDILPQVIYYLESFDFALVRSAIANYFLADLARKEVKVALSGEGADELFAGYHYLKDFDESTLAGELSKITLNLHHTNLQRCDRMSMAHGLEVRVPFLDDLRVVEFALSIPPRVKIRGGRKIEKWILRRASEVYLPQWVTWRRKEKFAEGAGLAAQLAAHFGSRMTDQEFEARRRDCPEAGLRNKEEAAYFDLFSQYYPRNVLHLVGRTAGV